MPITIGDGLSFCGRAPSQEELALIRQITREFSSLAVTELAATVCELLDWRRPNVGLKTRDVICSSGSFINADGCRGCPRCNRDFAASRERSP